MSLLNPEQQKSPLRLPNPPLERQIHPPAHSLGNDEAPVPPRDDAQKKQQLLRRCQGEELLELLPFHACDSSGARRVPCLLELQVQHIHARFAVYLTGKGTPNPPQLLNYLRKGCRRGKTIPVLLLFPVGIARSR